MKFISFVKKPTDEIVSIFLVHPVCTFQSSFSPSSCWHLHFLEWCVSKKVLPAARVSWQPKNVMMKLVIKQTLQCCRKTVHKLRKTIIETLESTPSSIDTIFKIWDQELWFLSWFKLIDSRGFMFKVRLS